MTPEQRAQIRKILKDCVDAAIGRVAEDSTYRPFHEELLTKELVAASAFERSFSTSFGQGPIEEISKILVAANASACGRQKETTVRVSRGAIEMIDRVLSELRAKKSVRQPNWSRELEEISGIKVGDVVERRVISDLWFVREGVNVYISIKTVKPNIDQTEIAKRDMLFLKANDPSCAVFFGLYYNPGGPNRSDYNWSMPSKIFNMKTDPCVLIGHEYWDYLGGQGTYRELLSIFAEVGNETRAKLLARQG